MAPGFGTPKVTLKKGKRGGMEEWETAPKSGVSWKQPFDFLGQKKHNLQLSWKKLKSSSPWNILLGGGFKC